MTEMKTQKDAERFVTCGLVHKRLQNMGKLMDALTVNSYAASGEANTYSPEN